MIHIEQSVSYLCYRERFLSGKRILDDCWKKGPLLVGWEGKDREGGCDIGITEPGDRVEILEGWKTRIKK